MRPSLEETYLSLIAGHDAAQGKASNDALASTSLSMHLRFINLSFWRNPSAAFFSIAFPLMFLTINSAIFGSATIQ